MTSLCEATLAAIGLRPDMVVDLKKLGLSEAAIAARRHGIGGSDATTIINGTDDEINELARFKMGGPPLDLSGELPAMLGIWTEPLNLAWLERSMGVRVSRRGEVAKDPNCSWRFATLDGWIASSGHVVQAKHVNGFWKDEELVRFYTPQVHHEMLCTGAQETLLSVIFGNQRHAVFHIPFDPLFAGELADAEEAFWNAVQAGEMPRRTPVELPPVPFDDMIELDMSDSNSFADAAARWLANQSAAKIFEAADKELKDSIPRDARRAWGHGVEVTRAKNNARRVQKMKE